MVQRAILGVLVMAVAALGFVVHAQHRQLVRLGDELAALRARDVRPSPMSVLRSSFATSAGPAAPATQAPAAAPIKASPRVPVTDDERARVESAVLSLLETDHPELRAKLQAVVQQEQQAMQHQQREARRERWVARREARLMKLSETVGVTPDQREAILTIMLANRDQIEELRREAQTPETIATSRDRIRALRDQADAQIRKQLTPEQYDAFRNQGDSDDDDRPPESPRAVTREERR